MRRIISLSTILGLFLCIMDVVYTCDLWWTGLCSYFQIVYYVRQTVCAVTTGDLGKHRRTRRLVEKSGRSDGKRRRGKRVGREKRKEMGKEKGRLEEEARTVLVRRDGIIDICDVPALHTQE